MFVRLCAAASLDGKISTAQRAPVTFTSRADRDRLFALRDAADAILIGAATIRAEDPPLLPTRTRRAARLDAGLRADPVRAVVSRTLDLRLGRALEARADAPVVVLAPEQAPEERVRALQAGGVEVFQTGSSDVDLAAALLHLEDAHGVRDLLCEGGGELNAGLLATGLVDEIHLTICPLVIGGQQAPTLADGAGFTLQRAPQFQLVECQVVEAEVFLTYARM